MEDNKNVSAEQETNQQNTQNEHDGKEPEVTVESLMAQLAQERAEKEKNKAALDKALKEKGEITKQLRARQTAEEQEAEAKKEQQAQHEAYVKSLERQIQLTEAISRYAAMGMDADLAKKTAEAEWIKNRPPVATGAGDEKTAVTKEQFNRMGYAQRVEFKRKYPETYKSFIE